MRTLKKKTMNKTNNKPLSITKSKQKKLILWRKFKKFKRKQWNKRK